MTALLHVAVLLILLALTRPLAQGHLQGNDGVQVVRPLPENVAMYPGGSVFANADDLGRFLLGMLSGAPLGKPAVASEFFRRRFQLPVPPEDRGKLWYGFGTVAYDLAGAPVFEHGGVRRGYGSFIRIIPGKKFGIAVLANLNGVSLRKSVAKATSVFAGLEEKRDPPHPPIAPAAKELAAIAADVQHLGVDRIFLDHVDRLGRQILLQHLADHPERAADLEHLTGQQPRHAGHGRALDVRAVAAVEIADADTVDVGHDLGVAAREQRVRLAHVTGRVASDGDAADQQDLALRASVADDEFANHDCTIREWTRRRSVRTSAHVW